MQRPLHTLLSLGLLLLVGCLRAEAAPAPGLSSKTNVLFVVFDTTRADHIGAYGYDLPTSPTIDGLAAKGVRFEHFVANASWTRPGFGALLTGMHPRSLGLYEHRHDALRPDITTLPERLKRSGYLTLGMTSNANVNAFFGFDQGYDTYEDTVIWRGKQGADATGNNMLETATDVTDRTLAMVDTNLAGMKGSPWFLQVVYIDPHTPLRPPEEFKGRMSGSRTPDYDAELAYADSQLARLLSELESRGVMDDTLIIITSDHGEGLRDHKGVPLAHGHGTHLYDSNVHVPLILSHPSLPQGKVSGALASQIDLTPTLIGLLGLPAASTDGMDLSREVKAPGSSTGNAYVISETDWQINDKSSVTTAEWKLVRNDDSRLYQELGVHEKRNLKPEELELLTVVPPVELYRAGDLENPLQTNVADKYPDQVASMTKLLTDWESSHPALKPINRIKGDIVVDRDGKVIRDDGDPNADVTMDAAMEAQLRELGYIED
jgi:arylsulfatase A-like enzyme